PSEAALPRGFRFAATACGLKKTGALDLAILSSDVSASAAAVFTQNLVVAAPVMLSKKHLQLSGGRMRAVVVNAGNANCATGARGEAASLHSWRGRRSPPPPPVQRRRVAPAPRPTEGSRAAHGHPALNYRRPRCR